MNPEELPRNIQETPVSEVIENDYYEELLKEFDRQFETITAKEYIEASGMKPDDYKRIFEPLRERVKEIAQKKVEEGHIPFVIVIKKDLISPEKTVPLIKLEGEEGGFIHMSAEDAKGFTPIEGLNIPQGGAYLIVDIETGKATMGQKPYQASKKIEKEGRSPLTLEEGVALITHHPELLKKSNMWMPGSHYGGPKVAGFWLKKGKPLMYFSWAIDSYPDWGSVSCERRIGR